MFMRNKLVWNAASCQISIWAWHMDWKWNDWLLRPAEAEETGFQERRVSLQRQLPSTPCSPNRPVLAKTSVFAEKNTAKKLTLGAWRQHSVIFTFLWSYFQALKSTPKIPHTQLWLEIFFFFFVSWEWIWGWDGLKLTCLPHPCLYLCFPLCCTASLK